MRAWNNVCSSRLALASLSLSLPVSPVACVLLLLLVDVALDQSNRGGSSQQAGKEGPGHGRTVADVDGFGSP